MHEDLMPGCKGGNLMVEHQVRGDRVGKLRDRLAGTLTEEEKKNSKDRGEEDA